MLFTIKQVFHKLLNYFGLAVFGQHTAYLWAMKTLAELSIFSHICSKFLTNHTNNFFEIYFSAPTIVDSLCKCFSSSIQVFSSSPMDVASEQKISHFLLYRQAVHNRIWKCVSMYGRDEHRVFGLEPQTEYDFVILAYNLRGECQLSNKVTLHTEPSIGY